MSEASENGYRIAAILGTSRPGNFTGRAFRLVVDELEKRSIAVDVIDPANMSLDFPGANAAADSERMQDIVAKATGVVFASPEYHGTFSAMSKLLIENMGFPSVLAGKPVALLGTAAGQIGAIKALEHLSGVLLHVGAIVVPGYVSVAGVQGLFDDDGNCLDEKLEQRIRGVGTKLCDYIGTNICPRLTLEQMLREQVG